MAQYLTFEHVEAPLELVGVPRFVEVIGQVMSGWPHRVLSEAPPTPPFFTISQAEKPGKYHCADRIGGTEPRVLNEINAVCDMIAAIPRALAGSNDDLICLHAAAVDICGRLVIFPNTRRAGKSTLTAALAKAGHAVFNDDVLPTSFDEQGLAFGRALGISPRLRLPLPSTIPAEFRNWVSETPGPSNKQYKYLNLNSQPPYGSTLRIGEFVVLDRQDEPVSATLAPVPPDAAMDVLLYQNFTRDRHSADVLKSIATALSNKSTFKLTYSGLDDAIQCLETAFGDASPSPAPIPSVPYKRFRMADLTSHVPTQFTSEGKVRRRVGTFQQAIGETLYLADAEGRAIHRMDALAAAIWELLDEPITADDLKSLLAGVFKEVPSARIAEDLEGLLSDLAKAGLVENTLPN